MDRTNNRIKQKWNVIRLIINRNKVQQSNCIIPNNILGKHYATVAETLAEKLPKISQDDIASTSKIKHYPKTSKQQFTFNKITDREVYELLLKLDSNKEPDIDNFDIKSLKSIANIISEHLASLFNQSITTGIYPQNLKIAKCVPVYKGAPLDPSDPVSYRPISILTSINKIFECILHNQLSKYLEEYKLLPPFQYGYRRGHNTSQAIADYTEHITKQISKKLCTIAVFMDLSKAFDTVDKTILKQKLYDLGMADISSSLINSYMSNRKLCMNNDKDYYKLTYGVPQGSILGHLLFIMYTFDMTRITEENKIIVYADDTTVLVSGKSLTETKQHCNDILNRFYQYFTLNKLSINPSKTKFMIYKPTHYKHKNKKWLHDTTHTDIVMNDLPLKQVKTIKFLGLMINDRLTWDDHRQLVYSKICKTLGLLYRCKTIMNENECINMYKTFIQPYFIYSIEVWGHSVQSDDILMKLQSKILRIIFNCKRSEDAWRHCNGKINSVKDLYCTTIKKMCMKHHYGSLPYNFSINVMPNLNVSQLQNKISKISLEQMYDYKYEPKLSNSHIKISCIKYWNSLPFNIKCLPYISSKETIHKNLKKIN